MNLPGATHRILVCRKDATQALQAFEGIALRMGLTINREKTRITKLSEGFDFIGFEFVKRRSPSSGKLSIYIHPSKSSQRNIRRRIKSFTKRRAPIRPTEFVKEVNQTVRGWVNYYRHTNASDAFRRLQRFINTRFRRYLNYRSKRPRLWVEEVPECGSVRPRDDLHRERSHQVRMKVCACCVRKTVGPPDSGKPNVRWDGKGNGEPATMGILRHCRRGNPQKQIGHI